MGRTRRRLHAIRTRLRAYLDQSIGILAYRRGRLAEARERLLAAVARDGGLYYARLFLGRIFAREGQLSRAAEEFRTASRIRPAAFLRHQAEVERLLLRAAVAGVASAVFLKASDLTRRAEEPEVEQPAPAPSRHLEFEMGHPGVPDLADLDAALSEAPLSGEERPSSPRPLRDDFTGDAERRRFERLPPLAPQEVRVTDWDDIGRRLLMPDPRGGRS